MSLNRYICEAKVPFEFEVKNPGEKNAFVGTTIYVRRDYKPEGEQYYPEDPIAVKVFGPQADFFKKFFPPQSFGIFEGALRMGEDYVDKDGNEKKGTLYLHVEKIHFLTGGGKNTEASGEEGKSKSAAKADSKPKGGNPLTQKKKGLPFK